MASDELTQRIIDLFYKENGDCCAGCDYWRFHNAVIGDCIKSAIVSPKDRISITEIESASFTLNSGNIITERDQVCGEFIDTFDWDLNS